MSYKHFDMEEFLRQTSGSEAIAREVAILFCRDYPVEIAEMESALEAGDFETVRRLSHKSKSGFLIIGAQELYDVAMYIEKNIKAGNLDVADKLRQYRVLGDALLAELKEAFGI